MKLLSARVIHEGDIKDESTGFHRNDIPEKYLRSSVRRCRVEGVMYLDLFSRYSAILGSKNSELIHSYFKLPQNEPDVDLRFTNNICVKLSPTFRAPGLAPCFRYQ